MKKSLKLVSFKAFRKENFWLRSSDRREEKEIKETIQINSNSGDLDF